MKQLQRILETLTTYRRHGWRLARALLRPATAAEVGDRTSEIFGDAGIEESVVDALWFTRPSHAEREAWELRLVAETPYALFETFEPDEAEEDREDVRREMEARLREYASRG